MSASSPSGTATPPGPPPPARPLRRLLAYFRPHQATLLLALLLLLVQSFVPGALVFLVQRVLDEILVARDEARLLTLPFLFVGLYALNGAITVGRGLLTRNVAWAVLTRLRRELFAHYLRLDAGWHQAHPQGERLARLVNDVGNIQYGVSGIVTAVQKPLTLLVLLGAAFHMNARLTLVAMLLLPLVAWPIDRFGRRLRQTSRQSLDNMAGLSASSAETLAGIRTVQANTGEQRRLAVFDRDNEEQRRLQMRAFAAQLLPGPVVELIASLGVALCIVVGGRQVFREELSPGELVGFMLAIALVNEPLKGIALIQSLTQRALAGAEAVFAILDTAPAVPDLGRQALPAGPLGLRFEGVGFAYEPGRPVLHAVDFEVQPGRMLALVGASGSGKSTIAALIPRFRDPTEGRVLLGGVDLRALPLAELRGAVALVSQEGFLFNDTVAANIAFGARPGEQPSPEQIEAAARVANAHDFIVALPRGYQTRIDELGMRLSGGQRQRICIARAVLRDAPVLVLDEATSALDTESEALVQEALDRLARARTVIAIAHRLSTIQQADEILVLDEGRVVERGRHEELLARGGVYAGLVRRQVRAEGG